MRPRAAKLMLALAVGLAACAPKHPPAPAGAEKEYAELQQALHISDWRKAVARLQLLAEQAPSPIAEEARFHRAILLVQHEGLKREQQALSLLEEMPDASLAPRLWLALADAYAAQGEAERVISAASEVLLHPWKDDEARKKALVLGNEWISRVQDEDLKTHWQIAVLANTEDEAQREALASSVAAMLSFPQLAVLHEQRRLDVRTLISIDRAFVRRRLLDGKEEEARKVLALVQSLAPDAPELRQMQAWLAASAQAVRIGLLLPLTGEHAADANAFLQGARMALGPHGMLIVEDTGGVPALAAAAAARLEEKKPDVVLGPMTEEGFAALPSQESAIEVWITLGRYPLRMGQLAASPSPIHQVDAIAQQMVDEGYLRVLVLSAHGDSEQKEAAAFVDAFTRLGGEVVEVDVLPKDAIDVRALLQQIRARTDDEALLYALDEDLALFSPEQDLAPRLPAGFDAIYLAAPGSIVYLLAPQFAWAGLADLPLYGSTRWDDGHLLDDRGRYLAHARFACYPFIEERQEGAASWREHWQDLWLEGEQEAMPSAWAALGYELVRVLEELMGRFGLFGEELVAALQDAEGFAGVLGRISFAPDGMLHIQPAMCAVEDGKIEVVH